MQREPMGNRPCYRTSPNMILIKISEPLIRWFWPPTYDPHFLPHNQSQRSLVLRFWWSTDFCRSRCFWVNYNISLTWIKAMLGWFPLLTMIPVRSQWGRYNLPRCFFGQNGCTVLTFRAGKYPHSGCVFVLTVSCGLFGPILIVKCWLKFVNCGGLTPHFVEHV